MGHVVLLGDSIFDNARYVPDRPAVIEQTRCSLPAGWNATLLAVDGDVVGDVSHQLSGLPSDATHLFVSVGGNDALGESSVLAQKASTVAGALEILHSVGETFGERYRNMLAAVIAVGKPVAVCTIYDAIPGLGAAERTALALFNEVILREAIVAKLPAIDLRLTCNRAEDYSHISAIEPSMAGGSKIARAIAEVATSHDFRQRRCAIYW